MCCREGNSATGWPDAGSAAAVVGVCNVRNWRRGGMGWWRWVSEMAGGRRGSRLAYVADVVATFPSLQSSARFTTSFHALVRNLGKKGHPEGRAQAVGVWCWYVSHRERLGQGRLVGAGDTCGFARFGILSVR